VYLGGNIRISPFNFIEKLDNKSIVVLEMSSFQLFHTKYAKKSPDVAIITNIVPEHLDWHKDFEDYINSKCFIFKYQKKNDILIADKKLKKYIKTAKSNVIYTNGENTDNVYKFGIAFNIDKKDIDYIISNFKGLEGRQELIGEINNRKFINDTFATHPAANLYMLKNFENPIVILGGVDKGFDLKKLGKEFEKRSLRLFIFKGSAGEKLLKKLSKEYIKKHVTSNVQTMNDAVEMAYKISKKGDAIVLSPGAASFNMFLNEVDRGKKFIKAVNALKKKV
jgi:UDP-N-acetylmuramoylalanine--D-glutamate ligase